MSLEVCAQIHQGRCVFEVSGFLKENALETFGHTTPVSWGGTPQNIGSQETAKLTLIQEERYTIGAWGVDIQR